MPSREQLGIIFLDNLMLKNYSELDLESKISLAFFPDMANRYTLFKLIDNSCANKVSRLPPNNSNLENHKITILI